MSDKELLDEDNVVRHVPSRHLKSGGKVAGAAFGLRDDEEGASVGWLECFGDIGKEAQLVEIRRVSRLRLRTSHRFAELNVGKTKSVLYHDFDIDDVRFQSKPLEATPEFPPDPSHSEIEGLPRGNSEHDDMIRAMIAKTVNNLHLAVVDQNQES